MSDDNRRTAGALLMIGLPGPMLDDSTRQLISEDGLSNFILFARNIENPDQLHKLCSDLAKNCHAAGLPSPLISIDQEGGTVARLPEPWTKFPDARILAESSEPEQALTDYARVCSKELLEMGINMNMAPVLDICPADEGYFMERRALGENPTEVARLASLVIEEMQRTGVAACGKHFPGLGAAKLDPHLLLPTVDREKSRLLIEDLLPFQAAAKINVAAIMTSHTIYTDIDPELPATLSPTILTEILRNFVKYDGMVVTDDLEMGAIENEMTVAEGALKSFVAGSDLLLICKEHSKIRTTLVHFAQAIEDGQLSQDRISASVGRINYVKDKFTIEGPSQ